jgi:hypothetical protein
MTIKTVTKLFGVDDAKLFPITEDSIEKFSCADGIDLPGVRQISLTYEIEEKSLTGDEKVLDVSNKIKSITFNIEYAKLSLEVLAQLTGGTYTTASTDDEEIGTFSFGGGDLPNYFQLKAQILDTSNDGGDVHFCIYKAKATAIPINGVQDDFATLTFDGKGVYTEHEFGEAGQKQTKLMDIEIHSKAKALSATVDKISA